MIIPTTAQLKKLIVLQKRKASLQKQISSIEKQLASILFSKPKAINLKRKSLRGTKKRSPLGKEILKALQNAGSKGMSIRELTKIVHSKPANVHVWFSTTGKKISGIKKIRPGVYVSTGNKK